MRLVAQRVPVLLLSEQVGGKPVAEHLRRVAWRRSMGDVALLAADIVGSEGKIVGVDTSADAMAAALARSLSMSRTNISYVTCDPAMLTFGRPFDAVVGRYVLLFQKDPESMLGTLHAKLAPGGVIAFHELNA